MIFVQLLILDRCKKINIGKILYRLWKKNREKKNHCCNPNFDEIKLREGGSFWESCVIYFERWYQSMCEIQKSVCEIQIPFLSRLTRC